MYNFEYKNTVKIIFGKGTIPMVAKELPKRAIILMTYGGGSIKNNGVYDQVKSALKGFKLFEFGGIEPNPHYETCMEAVKFIKENKISYLLSVGGGSVLDATKFIAAAACYKGEDPWDIIAKGAKVEEALPLADILTLPATGSEMNGNSVISRVSTQKKKSFASPLVLPKFSILDPETIFSLPNKQVANGVVDAFVHVMEQYLTFPVNSPLQDRFAESILLTLVEEGPKVLANRKDYNSAANYMWCATMALNGLIGVGVAQDWATHMIGHELTAFHGIDHAQTLAIVLPGVMNIRRNEKKEKILQYAERIWKIEYGTEDEKIDQAIAQTISFFERMGIATRLSDYGVPVETISKITSRFNKRGVSFGEKGDIGPGEVKLILQNRL